MKKFSKFIGSSIAIVAVLAFSASTTQAQPNLLVDGSFESGTFTANPITLPTVNQGWANNFGGATPSQSSAYAENGSYSLLTYNAVGNTWNPVGTYQIVSGGVTVGQQYTLSVYAMAPVALTTTYATPIDVQLQFFDASLANITTTETGWSALGAVGSWKQYSVTATAPAGAVYAAPYLMFMESGNQTAQDNVYFDNATLTVPEPSTLALLSLGLAVPFFIRRKS
jgi:hypothetical protein